MRKPKFKKQPVYVPADLYIQGQQSKRVIQEYSCGHCGFRYSDSVNENSKLCRTVICSMCKERSYIHLKQDCEETKAALHLLWFVKKLDKVFKVLRWFNPEAYFKPKK